MRDLLTLHRGTNSHRKYLAPVIQFSRPSRSQVRSELVSRLLLNRPTLRSHRTAALQPVPHRNPMRDRETKYISPELLHTAPISRAGVPHEVLLLPRFHS